LTGESVNKRNYDDDNQDGEKHCDFGFWILDCGFPRSRTQQQNQKSKI